MLNRALWMLLSFSMVLSAQSFADKEKDLAKLKAQIQATQQRITKQQSAKNTLQKDLRQSEKSLGSIKAELSKLQSQIKQQQKALNQLNTKQAELQKKQKLQQQQIVEQINLSYRLGRQSKLKALLNQEDPEKISRVLTYTDYVNKARLSVIDAYQKNQAELEKIRPQIQQQSKALLNSKETLVGQQKALQKNVAKRQQALARISSTLNNDKKSLQRLQQEQKELEQLLKAVEVAVQNIKLPSDAAAFASKKGKLQWPAKGKIEHRFGRKHSNMPIKWEGSAIIAKAGTKVVSPHHGRVVFADWFRGKGLLMIIDHGDGFMTLYAHNESLLREAGDWVSSGEEIATIGNSGGLKHNELYFEIRKNGQPLNPKKWLSNR